LEIRIGMEKIKVNTERIARLMKAEKSASIILTLEEIIKYARYLNFPNKTQDGSLQRTMHGTEFLHGLMRMHNLDMDLYQQLKGLAENPDLEYKIIIK
jgi:hypothetical protein